MNDMPVFCLTSTCNLIVYCDVQTKEEVCVSGLVREISVFITLSCSTNKLVCVSTLHPQSF